MSRFNFAKFDEEATRKQQHLKSLVEEIENFLQHEFMESRYRSLALTALEESYTWMNKAIRDEVVERTGKAEG